MDDNIIKTKSLSSKSDFVFIFSKPFYYEDVTQSLGLEYADYRAAIEAIIALNNKSGESFVKLGTTIERTITNADRTIDKLVRTQKLLSSGGQTLTIKSEIDRANHSA